ncbi:MULTISPECIES: barstar family protein [Limnobaculum]|nr:MULTISPECIES: barstar family protein [Limnobaculum]
MMRVEKTIILNLSDINDIDSLYKELALLFGFPDFFGRNVDAVIDCIFGVRYPEEGMTKINISKDGCLALKIKNFSNAPDIVKETIISIIEFVNYKYQFKEMNPAILLHLTK